MHYQNKAHIQWCIGSMYICVFHITLHKGGSYFELCAEFIIFCHTHGSVTWNGFNYFSILLLEIQNKMPLEWMTITHRYISQFVRTFRSFTVPKMSLRFFFAPDKVMKPWSLWPNPRKLPWEKDRHRATSKTRSKLTRTRLSQPKAWKRRQLLAYADDIDIIEPNNRTVISTFPNRET